jgi:CheY-like chemotaxis protein
VPAQLPFEPSQAKPWILVVEDEASIREVVREILEAEGYLVATAANGAEALRIMEQRQPALVLLDMCMPVLSGWDFAAAARAQGFRMPILIMTALPNARQWAAEIGAQGCLTKPFDLFDLLAAVERLLQRPLSGNGRYHTPA